MSSDNIGKYIFSIIFLGGCFTFTLLSFNKTYHSVLNYCNEEKIMDISKSKDNISKINNIINESIVGRYKLIESYGELNKLLGKKEINGFEYVIDKDGYLNSGNFWANIHTIESEPLAVRVKKLSDDMEKKGTKTMVLGFPEKYKDDSSKNYDGIPYNNHQYVMDEYLSYIRKYRIPYIDFRDTLDNSGLSYEEKYFKTDHHWKPEAAFECFVNLIDNLNEKFDFNLDENNYYRNLDNYNIENYTNMMLGSEGRSTGMNYAAAEDFNLIYPKDNNEYELYLNNGYEEWTYSGCYKEALISYDPISLINKDKDNIYTNSLYDIYLHGIKSETKIKNNTNKNGLKVLFLRDSFADPIAEFMAPLCSEIDMLWTKEYHGNIDEYIKKNNYDLVLVSFFPDDLNEEFFNFYKD